MNEKSPHSADTIITRHSERGGDLEYKGLSPEGVEKARERAKDFTTMIQNSDPGTVIFFGGSSYEERTGSTLEVYADEVKNHVKYSPDVLFFDEEQIAQEAKVGHRSSIQKIQEVANKNPLAKVVIDFPLVLRDFENREWLYDSEGKPKKEWMDMLGRYGKDYSSAIREWFSNLGVIDGKQAVPSPVTMAESYLNGIKRLEDFVKKFSGERKVKIVIVGHSFHIDALLTYLSNNGKIDVEGFEKIGNQVVDTTEMATIEPDETGALTLSYRDKVFKFEEQ
jgi:broad specificity phosphatase PhoE